MRYEESTTVNAPVEKVFDYVSNFVRHGEWSSHGLQITREGADGPVAVGTAYSTVAKQFGTQREKSTVVELSRNASFAWESTGALGLVRHWFTVAGANRSGTTLTKGFELLKPTFMGKLFTFRVKRDAPKNLRADLERIKSKLESSSS